MVKEQRLLGPHGVFYLVVLDANRPHELVQWFAHHSTLRARVRGRLARAVAGWKGGDRPDHPDVALGGSAWPHPSLQIVLSRRAGMERLHILRAERHVAPA